MGEGRSAVYRWAASKMGGYFTTSCSLLAYVDRTAAAEAWLHFESTWWCCMMWVRPAVAVMQRPKAQTLTGKLGAAGEDAKFEDVAASVAAALKNEK